MDFDIIPYDDIVWGARLGGGSFGSVYKGTYLGIDIAIKEVLPSTEYDVPKYFEREWRIMRECRHPNIVLFLGLSKAPEEDGRVFIISEYVPRGNLRQFILSSRPFPWRLRLSFATDVTRAVAYLHARLCIHRDLKGENLLITSNDRIKVTDFGFARIASRNADEMRRMTYCGTDGYMSPEIINGLDFDLPTDVFSLGIIFIEIMSRRLVDSKTYTRLAPSFTPDPAEVRRRASPGCPPDLIDLALACCLEEPTARPTMQIVLSRLRAIELEVMSRLPEDGSEHVGSIRLVNHGGKRAMPSFEPPHKGRDTEAENEAADAKMEEDALVALAGLNIDGTGASGVDGKQTWRTAQWIERDSVISQYTMASEMRAGHQRLLPSSETSSSLESKNTDSSAGTDIPSKPVEIASVLNDAKPREEDPSTSVMTVRQESPPDSTITLLDEPTTDAAPPAADDALPAASDGPPPATPLPPQSQIENIPSLPTSQIKPPSTPNPPVQSNQPMDASEQSEVPPKIPIKYDQARKEEREAEAAVKPTGLGTHRFTLVDKDAVPLINGKKVSGFTSAFAFAFLPKALGPTSKCPVCVKRLGQRPALQCDDCQILVHVKCSHAAPRNCAVAGEERALDESSVTK